MPFLGTRGDANLDHHQIVESLPFPVFWNSHKTGCSFRWDFVRETFSSPGCAAFVASVALYAAGEDPLRNAFQQFQTKWQKHYAAWPRLVAERIHYRHLARNDISKIGSFKEESHLPNTPIVGLVGFDSDKTIYYICMYAYWKQSRSLL